MKNKLYIFLALFYALSSCNQDGEVVNCVGYKQEIENLRQDIRDFAAESVCSDQFECRYIAFGSKPCGGPWEFLVYSTSINTEDLETLVANFNEVEANYNLNCNAITDCSTPVEPTGFSCEDNTCMALF